MRPPNVHRELSCPAQHASSTGSLARCGKPARAYSPGLLNGFCCLSCSKRGQYVFGSEIYQRYVAVVNEYCQTEPEERPQMLQELEEIAEEGCQRFRSASICVPSRLFALVPWLS